MRPKKENENNIKYYPITKFYKMMVKIEDIQDKEYIVDNIKLEEVNNKDLKLVSCEILISDKKRIEIKTSEPINFTYNEQEIKGNIQTIKFYKEIEIYENTNISSLPKNLLKYIILNDIEEKNKKYFIISDSNASYFENIKKKNNKNYIVLSLKDFFNNIIRNNNSKNNF